MDLVSVVLKWIATAFAIVLRVAFPFVFPVFVHVHVSE